MKIDIVAFDEENIAFVECKWRNKPVKRVIFEDLMRKSKLIDMSSQQCSFIVFSKVGCLDESDEGMGCFVV